ncbi:family 78 glycoside hydrolase catalytic domain [Butyrivibrio sp. AE3006]|uniref:family 78 glycoside hydrolase catalytic domain n=1 Tax=Butyrivibrio sp. AE3006 TaxID=1280673 RepID=UPI00042A2AF8|nr:family 78 glycoside hydrolase catalytic domain [Butyrivibrio sp. AE3006]
MTEKIFKNAKWITPEKKTEPDVRKGAGYLRKILILESVPENALLYATAHGLYEISVNGKAVTNARLTPGCTEYNDRLMYQQYDIAGLLKEGENEIFVTLGDGWYRGCIGIDGTRNFFGEDISFICEAIDGVGKELFVTDESWEGSGQGPILLTDLELGENYDARLEDIQEWSPVRTLDFDMENLVPQDAPYILEHEIFEGKLIKTSAGEDVYDFSQNLAGYTEIMIENAVAGQTITLIHGETLDENGNFTIANFQPGDRNKAGGIKQEINYICKDGRNEFKPHFSIFGFRYAKIVTDIPLQNISIRSIAVYSDMRETADFECSDEAVNKLFKNSKWSMKSNFCDIPTDCPTRERAGWTGDAGVFVKTGSYLMDCEGVYRNWLSSVRFNQHSDGKMAYISPRNGVPGRIAEMFSASVGWGDASVIVPYFLYKKSGDVSILSENYEMMKAWVGFLEKRAGKSKLKNRFGKNPYRKFIIDTGMDYGEWCEPGADVMKTMAAAFRDGQPEVATAFFSYSSRLLSEIACTLGKTNDADYYRDLSDKARDAYRYLVLKDGHIHSERQCEYVRPLAFGLLEEDEEKNAAEDLNRLVIDNGYHLNTGFLSTPFLCEVLAKHGYVDTAYKLLLQRTYPSWLYSVEKGATTIWETWDGIREDGTVHDSLNHYSYGAISGWLISGVLGINYAHDAVIIEPFPSKQLSFAKGYFDSPKGMIRVEWKYNDNDCSFHIEIPDGVTAKIRIHGMEETAVCGGKYDYTISLGN